MNHEELQNRIDHRFDRIEDKLDRALETQSGHAESLQWVRGFIKIQLTWILGLTAAMGAAWFRFISK